MRILILALLVAMCVSAGLIDLKPGSLKILIKEKVKKTMDRIKQVFNTNMLEFRKKLSGFKEKILKKLTLTEAQRKELKERLKLFKRKTTDVVSQAGDSIEEINIRSQIASALFQGDMVLSKFVLLIIFLPLPIENYVVFREQQDQVAADVSGTRSKRQAYNDKTYPGKRWSKGVHYFFDKGISNEVKSVFRKAAGQWMADTCINFTEKESEKDSIRVIEEDGCWSYVGRLGGKQDLSLGSGCRQQLLTRLVMPLGFFHTHSRHDRDKYITVDKENIKPDWLDQFLLETPDTNNNYDLTYDYGSIMHYGTTSATRNEKPTMVPTPDARYGETLGSPFISFYDLLMLNKYYNCTGE
ncbi:astacin [Cooperia oncophora]